MNMELLMYPLYVSFCGIWAEEIPDELETCPKSGYYADPTVGKPWSHTTAAGAGKWREISAYNEWTHDKAGTRASYPMPWRAGWKEWDIPVGWGQYRGELLGRCVPDPTTQRFDIEANGTVTVRKFGHWIKRNTSCDVWVDGNKVN